MIYKVENRNSQIIRNTIILYIRTLFVLFVKLYISRLLLKYLGVEDTGIYNIVGSFVALFSVLNGALTTSIQRFLTYSLGERDENEVQKVFSASLIILILLSLGIVLIAETVGLWYVNNLMDLPLNRLYAANVVYQFSIFTFVLNVISVPYNSILAAYENFKAFAYFDILNALLTLLVVVTLPIVAIDRLVYYGMGLLIIALIIRILYGAYCHKYYYVSHFKFVRDKHLYKRLFSFSFFSFFGNMGAVIGEGGINIVINLFFGVLFNATRGISLQVSNAVGGLIRSFTTALNPQITKSFAEQDLDRCKYLVFYSSKYSFLLLSLFLIPVVINIEYILKIWLTILPPQLEIFTQLTLLQSLIHILFNPITTIINATGNIKKYQIGTFFILIGNICLIGIIYMLGFSAYCGILIQCIMTFLQLLFSIKVMEQVTGISAKDFFFQVVLTNFGIFILCLLFSTFIKWSIDAIVYPAIISVFLSLISTGIICLFVGLSKKQRFRLTRLVFNIKCNKKHEKIF